MLLHLLFSFARGRRSGGAAKVFTVPSKIRQTFDILVLYSIVTAREQPLFIIELLHGKHIKICSALWDGIPRRLPDSPQTRGGTAHYYKNALCRGKARFWCVLMIAAVQAAQTV